METIIKDYNKKIEDIEFKEAPSNIKNMPTSQLILYLSFPNIYKDNLSQVEEILIKRLTKDFKLDQNRAYDFVQKESEVISKKGSSIDRYIFSKTKDLEGSIHQFYSDIDNLGILTDLSKIDNNLMMSELVRFYAIFNSLGELKKKENKKINIRIKKINNLAPSGLEYLLRQISEVTKNLSLIELEESFYNQVEDKKFEEKYYKYLSKIILARLRLLLGFKYDLTENFIMHSIINKEISLLRKNGLLLKSDLDHYASFNISKNVEEFRKQYNIGIHPSLSSKINKCKL